MINILMVKCPHCHYVCGYSIRTGLLDRVWTGTVPEKVCVCVCVLKHIPMWKWRSLLLLSVTESLTVYLPFLNYYLILKIINGDCKGRCGVCNLHTCVAVRLDKYVNTKQICQNLTYMFSMYSLVRT